ncbi:unnamed protein product [Aphis gossypii]|uniref:Uncharacterized protein n=1 Tax=Aphis gossypii TaxID=80765 RepID=A0A9P0JJA8_APHGO|nr:unnamed protein product [Aphis gossypii]
MGRSYNYTMSTRTCKMSSSIRMAGKQYRKHTHTLVCIHNNQTKYITTSFIINHFFFIFFMNYCLARATDVSTGCDGNANRSAHRTDSTGGLVRDRISFCLDAVDDKRAHGAPVVRSFGRRGGERGRTTYDKYVWSEPVRDCFIRARKVRDRLEVLSRTRRRVYLPILRIPCYRLANTMLQAAIETPLHIINACQIAFDNGVTVFCKYRV